MKKLFLIICILFISTQAFAANKYITPTGGGTHSGDDFTNAYAGFTGTTWTRGNIYYIAGGTYNENITGDPEESGASWIKIWKATASANNGVAGWSIGYDAQAVINGYAYLGYGYIEIDGVTGSGTSGHGIKFNMSTDPSLAGILWFYGGYSASPRHVHHVEVQGAGKANTENGVDGIYFNSYQANTKGLHISNCWVHETTRSGITTGNTVGTSYSDYGALIENNVISETGSNIPAIHGQGLQLSYAASNAYTIIRNNIFRNISGTGNIVFMDGSATSAATHSQSRIYNNVFYYTDLATYGTASPGVIVMLPTTVGGWPSVTADSVFIYNNTFYNIGSATYEYAMARIWGLLVGGTNLEAKNNLFVNSYFPSGHYHVDVLSNNDYYNNTGASVPTGETGQQTETADPFTSAALADFTLKGTASGSIGNGLDLSSIFTTDITGATRATWDIGAYWSGSEAEADTTPPSVAITQSSPQAISANSLAISGTASDAVGVSSCKYRLGSAPDASNGTALTGTTSWSGTVTTFSSGANTLYAGCADAAGNWGSANITVNYTPSAAPSMSGCTISGGSVH